MQDSNFNLLRQSLRHYIVKTQLEGVPNKNLNRMVFPSFYGWHRTCQIITYFAIQEADRNFVWTISLSQMLIMSKAWVESNSKHARFISLEVSNLIVREE